MGCPLSGAEQALVSDTGDTAYFLTALLDALNAPHNPADDWMKVGRSFVAKAVDHIEWLELGNKEWRDMAVSFGKQAKASRATAQIAIGHLQRVLSKCQTQEVKQQADAEARQWLESIGSEPT